ncbi:MAG TPA: hypothetical protein DEB57_03770, partial [Microbacterium sp.]|nr:hypothetical protein [Microbacterium sp.]
MTESTFLPLNLPVGSSRAERAKFLRLCRALSESPASGSTHARWLERAGLGDIYAQPALAAAAHTAIDLVDQGWVVHVDRLGPLFSPPAVQGDRDAEKSRIRAQEHLR